MQTNLNLWPELDWEQWKDTADTLHMWMQIVGKTRLALTPTQNHWWNVPLYVTARGLTTSAMPIGEGDVFDIEFDFIGHQLVFRRGTGEMERIALKPDTVSQFYAEYQSTLRQLRVDAAIDSLPVEIQSPIRFDQDTIHKSYDSDAVRQFWQILCHADRLFKRFSTNYFTARSVLFISSGARLIWR